MSSKKVVLHFPRRLVDQPIIYRLSRDFDLEFNILRASVTPKEEGLMVLELLGRDESIREALEYLEDKGVKVQMLARDVSRDEDRCTHCGVCVSVCPVEAFSVDRHTAEVVFDKDKCIACELCVKVCPYRAMKVTL